MPCTPFEYQGMRGIVCTRPAYTWWLHNDGAQWAPAAISRAVRRQQFRFWVRAHVAQFLQLTNFKMPEAT